MSYSCSENQPGTDMVLMGFQPSPSRHNFLLAKAAPEELEPTQQLCPTPERMLSHSQGLLSQTLCVTGFMSYVEAD